MIEPTVPLAPGVTFQGKYRILSLVGQSLHAVVYNALDEAMQRRVALKVIPIRTDSPQCLAQAQGLTKIIAQLHHPRLVPSLDAGISTSPLSAYVAMDWAQGHTLRDCLGRHGEYGAQAALDTAIQVCDGLQYAHLKGMFHGNLTPANIIVERGAQIRVLGTGMAELHAHTTDPALPPGCITGTPRYLAPEQLLGEPVDATTDVFGVGLLLYEMLSRRAPDLLSMEKTALHQFVTLRLQAPPTPVSAWVDDLPESLVTLMLRAVAKDRSHRFQSLAEMGDQCRGVLAQVRSASWSLHLPSAAGSALVTPARTAMGGASEPVDGAPVVATPGAPSVASLAAAPPPSVSALHSVPAQGAVGRHVNPVNAVFPRIPAPSFVSHSPSEASPPPVPPTGVVAPVGRRRAMMLGAALLATATLAGASAWVVTSLSSRPGSTGSRSSEPSRRVFAAQASPPPAGLSDGHSITGDAGSPPEPMPRGRSLGSQSSASVTEDSQALPLAPTIPENETTPKKPKGGDSPGAAPSKT